MEKEILSRANLDSLSTQDLLSIADDYGIEIPDNLNRRFIIEELLEAAEEFDTFEKDEDALFAEDDGYIPDSLPSSYNETSINLILRNPAWIFAFWDISEITKKKLLSNADFNYIFLHISFFNSFDENEKSIDAFDINIDFDSKEQYILIPSDKKIVKINLAADISGLPPEVLASTEKIEIPSQNEFISNFVPGKKMEFPTLVSLSGIKSVLHDDYINHRELFSN